MARQAFGFGDLGRLADMFHDLILPGNCEPMALKDVVGLTTVLADWEAQWNQRGQSDTAEFLTFWLSHGDFDMPCYQMHWQKRVIAFISWMARTLLDPRPCNLTFR